MTLNNNISFIILSECYDYYLLYLAYSCGGYNKNFTPSGYSKDCFTCGHGVSGGVVSGDVVSSGVESGGVESGGVVSGGVESSAVGSRGTNANHGSCHH